MGLYEKKKEASLASVIVLLGGTLSYFRTACRRMKMVRMMMAWIGRQAVRMYQIDSFAVN